MNRTFILCTLLAAVCTTMGCTRVRVKKVTSCADTGIRYYRPKPYLFVTGKAVQPSSSKSLMTVTQGAPLEVKTVSHQADDTPAKWANFHPEKSDKSEELPAEILRKAQDNSPGKSKLSEISMALQYLPDFAEEYAIDFQPGLGSGELNVTLENGWNLTSIGVKTDQQTDEIIGSVASLIGQLPVGPKALSDQGQERGMSASPMVYGSNVPFGYYEAVIACAPNGRKQLYGWRYVGFMPFQSCPIQPSGLKKTWCGDGACQGCAGCGELDEVYGLVHVDGVLQFARIGSIPKQPVNGDGFRRDDVSHQTVANEVPTYNTVDQVLLPPVTDSLATKDSSK